MRRQDKYPDTKTFHFYNANPKNRITGDCVIRAISTALEIPYNQVVMELAELQCETGYDDACKKGYSIYLEKKGWIKMSQPRKSDDTKYTGREFCEMLQRCGNHKNMVAHIGGHHVIAIVDGVIQDIWNSEKKCIGNYWIKG